MSPRQALATSKLGAQPPESRARKRSPEPFVLCRIRNREAAGNLMKVYLLTAWIIDSADFAFSAFSEVSSLCSQPEKMATWPTKR
jgi:hypothetical protein